MKEGHPRAEKSSQTQEEPLPIRDELQELFYDELRALPSRTLPVPRDLYTGDHSLRSIPKRHTCVIKLIYCSFLALLQNCTSPFTYLLHSYGRGSSTQHGSTSACLGLVINVYCSSSSQEGYFRVSVYRLITPLSQLTMHGFPSSGSASSH